MQPTRIASKQLQLQSIKCRPK